MIKDVRFFRYGFLLISLIFASGSAFAQDLGSSSGLFNPTASKSSKTAKKKTTPKKNSSASAKLAVTKPRPTIANRLKSKKIVQITKSKSTLNTSYPQPRQTAAKDIVITVGLPTEPAEKFDEQFEQAIEDGNSARDDREYAKAEVAYLRAQSLKKKDSRAVYGLGNLFSDQQRWEEAERAYRAAIQIEPSSPEAYIALSFVLTQPISGENLGSRYAEAEKLARQAIKIDSGNALAYDQLGVALELQGRIGDETRNAYKKAIDLDSAFALAYAHLGRLLRKKGLINESSAAYKMAIQLSTDVPMMILVADVMQSQQRYVDSEQLLRRALRQDAKNPTALYLLGRALTVGGNYDEAEKVLKKSADVSPNSFVSYALLGSLFVRREKFNDAEKYLMKALRVVSANEKKRLARDFEMVGDGFLRVGKQKDAVRVYRQALNLDNEKAALADKLSKIQKD